MPVPLGSFPPFQRDKLSPLPMSNSISLRLSYYSCVLFPRFLRASSLKAEKPPSSLLCPGGLALAGNSTSENQWMCGQVAVLLCSLISPSERSCLRHLPTLTFFEVKELQAYLGDFAALVPDCYNTESIAIKWVPWFFFFISQCMYVVFTLYCSLLSVQ